MRVREYLDELYRPAPVKNGKKFPGPWQTCPKRMLRHKAQAQGVRLAYGLSGLFEPDEAERILESHMGEPVPPVLQDVKGVQDSSVVVLQDKSAKAQHDAKTAPPDSPESNTLDIIEGIIGQE